jgi:peptide/nickel transport system substrate-binding protein
MLVRLKWISILSIVVTISFLLTACGSDATDQAIEDPVQGDGEEPVDVLVAPAGPSTTSDGIMVTSNFADATILNPILAPDAASYTVVNNLFLSLLSVEEFSGEIVGKIADSWTASEDGLTYTFNLRDDIYWTDGTPVTAQDVKFTYEAMSSDLVNTPHKGNVEMIESIKVVDDYSLELVFRTLDCSVLYNFFLGILPSHMYAADFSDIMSSPLNEEPMVTNGPFKFLEWVKDDHITLVRNDNYYLGLPNLEGWIYRVFADNTAMLAAFLAGEVDLTNIGPQFSALIENEIDEGQPFIKKEFFNDGYTFVGFNLADPENPQLGWIDSDGDGVFQEDDAPNLDQDPHPILSDALVRKAIAHSLDYTNIINEVVYGKGAPIAANVLPTINWAYNAELEPYAYDPVIAATLLDEAGWVLEGDEEVRTKDGELLSLSILTNAGNDARENIALFMQDNLNALGFDITLDILEWGTVVNQLMGQQFDMVVMGWIGMGADPDDSAIWAYRYDDPGDGFNFISYYNQEVEEKVWQARAVKGCSDEERGELYKEVQAMIHDDVPYAFLYNPQGIMIWNTRLAEINPGPWSTYYNVHQWYLTPQ